MKSCENWTEEERKKHDRSIRMKSFLSGLGFIAIILAIFLMKKYSDYTNTKEWETAYKAGYNVGYYLAFSEDEVIYYDTDDFMDFIDRVCTDNEEEGFKAGLSDGRDHARVNKIGYGHSPYDD